MKPFLDMADKAAVLAYLRSRSLIWPEVEGRCFEWMAYRTPDGYGQFTAGGKRFYVHREAFKASGRRIPDGSTVDHLCQNKACWNPDHLSVATREENTRRARNAFWVAFMKENRSALNVVRKLGGSVVEPSEVNQ
ncbi:HNH endonuclease [Streptomyces sp. NBC_01764]|uniref:HNH endonuclease signature motif containing protein n=1 Tax=Streptomyces sp. NBC_01764 TaxID=2975935 RepID=UPI0022520524|nr:HNH endonuclease signature motif containing protein [Streptomyces sp. NBC_01764]MCX4400641.1 HNH endonuclease [Streptomyces sp. NBC_01764]